MLPEFLGAKELSARFGIPERTIKRRLAQLEALYGDRYVVRRGPKGRARAIRSQFAEMIAPGPRRPRNPAQPAWAKDLDSRITAIATELVELKRKLRDRGLRIE